MKKECLFITGASSDIGIALIEKVADEYRVVVGHYCHMNSRLEELSRKIGEKLYLIYADFNDSQSVAEMIREIKERGFFPSHIVHLTAAKFGYVQFKKTAWKDVETNTNISVRSLFDILKAFIPQMVSDGYGKVVAMCSSCVIGTPPNFLSAYVSSKYQLLGFIKSLSVEYAEQGICVNALSPDMVDTKFLSSVPSVLKRRYAKTMAGGRLLEVNDVLPTIEYLLSESSDHITGENIVITGE